MTIPDLPTPNPTPIERVSPSLANQLLTCELRVAFGRDKAMKFWRRPTTFTILGEVAHAVTEAAFKRGDWAQDPSEHRTQLDAMWTQHLETGVAKLATAWNPAIPPPAEEWPGYQLTRTRTIRRAMRLLSSRGPAKQAQPDGTGVEVDLEDPSTGLFGRADRIEHHGGSFRVVDLKSGLHQGEPTADQRRQLLLYAVLVERNTGKWPTEIAIESASGEQTTMPLDPAEAEASFAEVLGAVERFNAHAAAGDVSQMSAAEAQHCRWCPFRVVCGPYWSAFTSDWEHNAVLGRILDAGSTDGGGFAQLEFVSPSDRAGETVHISGLADSVPSESTWLAAVDVGGPPGSDDLRARWWTVARAW